MKRPLCYSLLVFVSCVHTSAGAADIMKTVSVSVRLRFKIFNIYSDLQQWNVTKYCTFTQVLYLSTVRVFSFWAMFCICSTYQSKILYILLHEIYLKFLVTLQIKNFAYILHEDHRKFYFLSQQLKRLSLNSWFWSGFFVQTHLKVPAFHTWRFAFFPFFSF